MENHRALKKVMNSKIGERYQIYTRVNLIKILKERKNYIYRYSMLVKLVTGKFFGWKIIPIILTNREPIVWATLRVVTFLIPVLSGWVCSQSPLHVTSVNMSLKKDNFMDILHIFPNLTKLCMNKVLTPKIVLTQKRLWGLILPTWKSSHC